MSQVLSNSLPPGLLVLFNKANRDSASLAEAEGAEEEQEEEPWRSGGKTCSATRLSLLMNITSWL